MPKRPKKPNQSNRNRKATKVRGRVGPGQPAAKPRRGRPRKQRSQLGQDASTAPIGVASAPFVHADAEESESESSLRRHHDSSPETLACHLHRMMPNKEELDQVVDTHVALVDKATHDAVPELCPRATALIAKYAVSRVDITNEKGTCGEFGALEQMARLFLSYFDMHKKVKDIASDYQKSTDPLRTTNEVLDDFRPMFNRMFLRQLDVMSDSPSAVFEVNALTRKVTPPASLDECDVSIDITQFILSTTIEVELYWQTCDPETLPKQADIKLVARVPLYSTMMGALLSTKVFDLLTDRLALPEWLSAEEFIQILMSPLDLDYNPTFKTVEVISEVPSFDDFNLFGLRPTKSVAHPISNSLSTPLSSSINPTPSVAFRFVDAAGPSVIITTCEKSANQTPNEAAAASSSDQIGADDDIQAADRDPDAAGSSSDVEMIQSGAEEDLEEGGESTEEGEYRKEHGGHKRLSMARRMLKVMDEWSAEYFAYSRLILNVSHFFGHLDLLPMINRLYVEEVRPEYRATNYLLIAPREEAEDQLPQQHQQLQQHLLQQELHPQPPPKCHFEVTPQSFGIIYTSAPPPKPKRGATEDDYLNSHVVISVMHDLKRGGIPCIQVQFDPDPLSLSGRLLTGERLKRRVCRVLGRRLGVPEGTDPVEWVSALTTVSPEMWQGEVAEQDETGEEYEERYVEAEGSGCQIDRFRKTPRQHGHTTWIGVRNQLMRE